MTHMIKGGISHTPETQPVKPPAKIKPLNQKPEMEVNILEVRGILDPPPPFPNLT